MIHNPIGIENKNFHSLNVQGKITIPAIIQAFAVLLLCATPLQKTSIFVNTKSLFKTDV